jgi:arylsulfatase A-like enzyme
VNDKMGTDFEEAVLAVQAGASAGKLLLRFMEASWLPGRQCRRRNTTTMVRNAELSEGVTEPMLGEGKRPNILWIVSEDYPPRFGCYRDPLARTSNVDSLAARRVLFERAYCCAPVCAHARFALFTGVAPESNAPVNQMRAVASVPSWMRTYPEIVRDLGYYCTNNLKTDYNANIDPAAVWDDCSGTATWRNRPEGKPFLAVFNFDGTHESSVFGRDPFVVNPADIPIPPYLPDTPGIREDFAQYYRKVSDFDHFVGVLLRLLEEDGLTNRTIVIHTSDHGGVHPRSKRFCYDEGLHVPLIIAAPGPFAEFFRPHASRIDAPVIIIRIPPTLIDIAAGEVPQYMQGESMLRSEFDVDTELAFAMRNRMDERDDIIRTVRDSRFRYIKNYYPHPYAQHQAFGWLVAGYQSWEEKLLAGRLNEAQSMFWRPKPGVELYDTIADPDEINNLAGDPGYAADERRLSDALNQHILAVHDNGFLVEGSVAKGYDASPSPLAYPLDRIVDVADAVTRQDPRELPRFFATLSDPDPTVRRWGAIGVLALGAIDDVSAERLRMALGEDPEPSVVIPCGEALARYRGEATAVARLTSLVDVDHSRPVRLEALGALTALALINVRPLREVVAAASEDTDLDVASAGSYLLQRLDGNYNPRSPTFAWEKLVPTGCVGGAAGNWTSPERWPDDSTVSA